MSERVLLTGATGFLGMEVLVRLLQREDTEVIALVRAADRDAADARLQTVLATLFEDRPELPERVIALPGDMAASGLGLSRADRATITSTTTAVVHCAASIAFDLPLAEAMEINCAGTVRLLDLAAEIANLQRFVHVSTAYVSGCTNGVFSEEDLDRGQRFRNTYERSKFAAEQAVAARADELPLVVVRPSIVVGDRHSGWTPAFNVIYWPLRAFARGLLKRVPVDPAGIADIVPVDYVADALMHLLSHREVGGCINLVAGEHAVTNAEFIRLACECLDRPPPELSSTAALPSVGEAQTYLPYFDVATRFDDRRALRHLVPSGVVTSPLADFFPTIVRYALRAGWGKRNLTRESAGARA